MLLFYFNKKHNFLKKLLALIKWESKECTNLLALINSERVWIKWERKESVS